MKSTIKRFFPFALRKRIYTVNENLEKKIQCPNNMKDELFRGCIVIPRRYIVVLMGFLIFAVLNTQRVNMVIAIVAMTNSTKSEEPYSVGQECPSSTGQNSTVLTAIRGTFNWSTKIQGYIIGSSFLGFVLTQIIGGRLSDTLGPKQMLIFSIFCASLCNLLSPLSATWNTYLLIAVQFLKGMAQGFMLPAISCLMVRWLPKPERSFLSSIIFSGYPAGALFGGITSGALCDTDLLGGWPSVFYFFGFHGMVLALLLQFYIHNSPEEDNSIRDSELQYIICNQEIRNVKKNTNIPLLKMFLSIPTWALLAGMFGQYWMTFYFISVHPSYLATVLNFNVTQSGVLSSMPYILQLLTTWFASYVSDWLSEIKFASTDSVRKACNTISCLGFSLSLLGVAYAGCSAVLNTVFFFIALGSIGFGFPGSLTVPIDMTVEYAGTLTGISSTVASTSGFIIPVIVGQLTTEQQTLTQWHKVFAVSATVVMSSCIIFHCFGSAELQDWEVTEEENRGTNEEKPGIISRTD